MATVLLDAGFRRSVLYFVLSETGYKQLFKFWIYFRMRYHMVWILYLSGDFPATILETILNRKAENNPINDGCIVTVGEEFFSLYHDLIGSWITTILDSENSIWWICFILLSISILVDHNLRIPYWHGSYDIIASSELCSNRYNTGLIIDHSV